MSILLGSSLFGEMSTDERELLLDYLVASYYEPRFGEHSWADLRSV